jgi:mannose-6-phosphate isomerase-like protein (cupin superfamily)
MTFETETRALLGAVATLYRAAPAGSALTHAAVIIDGLTSASMVEPEARSLPVGRCLAAACASAQSGPLANIADGFASLADRGVWQQNPNYVNAPPSPDFLEHYGYVEFIGPGRTLHSTLIRVGFLMLGPKTVYPPHAHPAEEVYHVVGGQAQWWRDGVDWHVENPGAAIHHAPHVPQATRCKVEPLLALYCWSGEIEAAARLV